jgi:proteic killer suppression protein
LNILFKNKKLEKIVNDQKKLLKQYGTRRGKLIRRRLDDFEAAEVLSAISKLPPVRCHELSGGKNGMLAVDLDHPYRLVFQPADEPIPLKSDGGLDWDNVKTIKIMEVTNYH